MVEFTHKDLQGSRFEDVHLGGSRFDNVHLGDTHFQNVWLGGARLSGVGLVDVDISGEIENLRINGVDVGPLVEAELNRRHPDRAKMRPHDADGFREAWDILERLWAETVERARGMAPELLHERVDGEWSFIETLRHLVFATDAWVNRALLGEPSPWDPLDLPHDEMADAPGVPRDRAARPSLDEVLALRADRMATVRRVIADLTDEQLAGTTEPVTEPGYPESRVFAVTPVPAGHPQRGVGAPAVRRARPRRAQRPVAATRPLPQTQPRPRQAAAPRGLGVGGHGNVTWCGSDETFLVPGGAAATVGSNEASWGTKSTTCASTHLPPREA